MGRKRSWLDHRMFYIYIIIFLRRKGTSLISKPCPVFSWTFPGTGGAPPPSASFSKDWPKLQCRNPSWFPTWTSPDSWRLCPLILLNKHNFWNRKSLNCVTWEADNSVPPLTGNTVAKVLGKFIFFTSVQYFHEYDLYISKGAWLRFCCFNIRLMKHLKECVSFSFIGLNRKLSSHFEWTFEEGKRHWEFIPACSYTADKMLMKKNTE